MSEPTIVGLVPARAGSKRVQNKNIRILGEHPLIAYTIAAAQASDIFTAIVVSTDSPQIAETAAYYGAEVPFLRPAEYATDTSPDIQWVQYTLAELGSAGRHYDAFSILRPTSPFRKAATINRAWEQFLDDRNVDSLRAVERCSQHPGKMWVVKGSRMTPFVKEQPSGGTPWHSMQYQSLPLVYVQNASLEIAWTRVVFELSTIAGNNIMPFISHGDEGFDINNQEDWWLAEHMLAIGEASLPSVNVPPFRESKS